MAHTGPFKGSLLFRFSRIKSSCCLPTLSAGRISPISTSNMSKRNVLIAFLRNDLRLHDHPVFSQCAEPSPSSTKFQKPVTHILPVYVFDQRMIEVGGLPGLTKAGKKSNTEARTRLAQFWRTGPPRVRFVTRSLFDLKKNLEQKGAGLSIHAVSRSSCCLRSSRRFRRRGTRSRASTCARR